MGFFKHDLKPLKLNSCDNYCQYFKVLIFLITTILQWFLFGLFSGHEFPFDIALQLTGSIFSGKVLLESGQSKGQVIDNRELIANLAAECEKYSDLVLNEKGVSISDRDRIRLEQINEFVLSLLQTLDIKNGESKNRVAASFYKLETKERALSSANETIKARKYKQLQKHHKQKSEKRFSSRQTCILSCLNKLRYEISIYPPSSDLLFNILDFIDRFKSERNKILTINDISGLIHLRSIFEEISDKLIFGYDDTLSLVNRANYLYNLVADLKDRNCRLKGLARDYNIRLHEQQSELEKTRVDLSRHQDMCLNLEDEIKSLKTEIENIQSDKDELVQQPWQYLRKLQEYYNIRFVMRKSSSVFHSNPGCRDWRSFVFEYLGDPNSTDIIIWNSDNDPHFYGKNKCHFCEKEDSK